MAFSVKYWQNETKLMLNCVCSAGLPFQFTMTEVCKFCDLEVSSCSGTGTCMSNCSRTAICADPSEVCVAIW